MAIVIPSAIRTAMASCGCHACRNSRHESVIMRPMILCPTCGNKRCPKASDHRHECTGSNEPGQKGSVYE